MLLVPVVVVVIDTTPPDTVRFPVTRASWPTSSVGALTVWDTNRFPKTLCELVTVRFEVSMLDALRVPPMKASLVTEFRLVIVRLDDSILEVLRL